MDLSFYNPYDRKTAVYTFETSVTAGVHLTVNNVPETVGFFIVQVHSHTIPLQLCNATDPSVFVNGTNIGLVQMNHKLDDVYLFDIKSIYTNRMNIMLAITIYNRKGMYDINKIVPIVSTLVPTSVKNRLINFVVSLDLKSFSFVCMTQELHASKLFMSSWIREYY